MTIVNDPLETGTAPLEGAVSFGADALEIVTAKRREVANADAVNLAQQLETEGRAPTPDERRVLLAYSGVGGTTIGSDAKADSNTLGLLNEYYTPVSLARAIWVLLERLGFSGGSVLEPSSGTGVFLETAPEGVQFTAVELNPDAARINRLLHRAATVRSSSFEADSHCTDELEFDLVIGNPPFGARGMNALEDKPQYRSYAPYFLDAGLDRLRDGGLLAFVIPSGLMDAPKHLELRAHLLARARLRALVRLPISTFEASGARAATDVIVLEKHPWVVGDTLAELVRRFDPRVLASAGVLDATGRDFLQGQFYSSHADHVLGELVPDSRWGGLVCEGDLETAVERLKTAPILESPRGATSLGGLHKTLESSRVFTALAEARGETTRASLEAAWRQARIVGYPHREGLERADGRAFTVLKRDGCWTRSWQERAPQDPTLESAFAAARALDAFHTARLEGNAEVAEGARLEALSKLERHLETHGNPHAGLLVPTAARTQPVLYRLLGVVRADGAIAPQLLEPQLRTIERSPDLETLCHRLDDAKRLTVQTLLEHWEGGSRTAARAALLEGDAWALLPDGRFTAASRHERGDVLEKAALARAQAEVEPDFDERAKLLRQADRLESLKPRRTLEEIDLTGTEGWIPVAAIQAWLEQDSPHLEYSRDESSGRVTVTVDPEKLREARLTKTQAEDDQKLLSRFFNLEHTAKVVTDAKRLTPTQYAAARKARIEEAQERERALGLKFRHFVSSDPELRELLESRYRTLFDAYHAGEDDTHPLELIGWSGPALHGYQCHGTRFNTDRANALLAFDTGLGKALAADTAIMTPTGARAISELKVGDRVIGSNGCPTTVIGVYPQGVRPAYRVTFTDGVSVVCDENHLWSVQTSLQRSRGQPYRTLTLREIMKEGLRERSTLPRWRHFIPVVAPVHFESKALTLDPYVLGALLGDGGLTTGGVMFSTADQELLEEITRRLPQGVRPVHRGAYDYGLVFDDRTISRDRRGRIRAKHPLTCALRDLGLMGLKSERKFIPEAFKFAAVDDRVELLQGLLDTDGSVRSKDNNIEFCTASPRLAEDVAFLIRSLGGTARIRTKPTSKQLAYRMSVILPNSIQPFKLSRKANVHRPRSTYPPVRAISRVEPTNPQEMVCIAVDAQDQLFVANGFIVTHNTLTGIATAESLLESGRATRVMIVVPKGLLVNWARNLETALPFRRVLTVGISARSDGGFSEDEQATVLEKLHGFALGAFEILLISREWFRRIRLRPENLRRFIAQEASLLAADDAEDPYGLGEEDECEPTERQRTLTLAERQAALAGRLYQDNALLHLHFEDLGADALIVDEAGSLKNLYAAPTYFGKKPKFMGASLESDRAIDTLFKVKALHAQSGGRNVYYLTATPTKNSPLELFNILKPLAGESFSRLGIFGPAQFVERYCLIETVLYPNATGELEAVPGVVGFKNLQELRGLMGQFILARTAEDVGLQIPDLETLEHIFDLTARQQAIYRQLRLEAQIALSDPHGEHGIHLFGVYARMRLLTLEPSLYAGVPLPNPRFEVAARLAVEAVNRGGKLVCFMDVGNASEEDETGARRKKKIGVDAYDLLKAAMVHAGIPGEWIAIVTADRVKGSKRQQIADDYNAGKLRVIIGSTGTIGEGFDLQVGTTDLVHLDIPWDPGTFHQRVGRGHRQGNDAAVIKNHILLARGSFDGLTYAMMRGKRGWQEQLWRSGEDTARNNAVLSYDEILAALSDDPDAARLEIERKRADIESQKREARWQMSLSQFRLYLETLDHQTLAWQKALGRKKGATANDHKLKGNFERQLERYRQALRDDASFEYAALLDGRACLITRGGAVFGADVIFNLERDGQAIEWRVEAVGFTTSGDGKWVKASRADTETGQVVTFRERELEAVKTTRPPSLEVRPTNAARIT